MAVPPDRPPLSVLIVEDAPDTAESLALFLRLHGQAVRVAHTGPAALAACADARPDVVLLDIGLPGMSGWEVAERVRRTVAPAPLLVAVTGYGTAADEQKSAAAGIDLHLLKPVDPDVVLDLLHRFAPLARRSAGPGTVPAAH
jgi:two-component system, OmpR family, response regulator